MILKKILKLNRNKYEHKNFAMELLINPQIIQYLVQHDHKKMKIWSFMKKSFTNDF